MTRFAVYDPSDGFRDWHTLAEAIAGARKAFESIEPAEGWPEDIARLGVYTSEAKPGDEIDDDDWKPLWTLSEVPGSRRWGQVCPEERENHDDCESCEGHHWIDNHGDPWEFSDEFAYTVNYAFPAEVPAS